MSATGNSNLTDNTATGDETLTGGIQYEQPNDNGILVKKDDGLSKLYKSGDHLFFNNQALTGPAASAANSVHFDTDSNNPYSIPDETDGERLTQVKFDDQTTKGNITFSSDSFNFDKNIISPNVDATNKTDIAGKVNKSGDTMSGTLDMDSNPIKLGFTSTTNQYNPVLYIGDNDTSSHPYLEYNGSSGGLLGLVLGGNDGYFAVRSESGASNDILRADKNTITTNKPLIATDEIVMNGNPIELSNTNNATIEYSNPTLNFSVNGANHNISLNGPSQAGAINIKNTTTDINQDINITNGSSILFDGEGSISYNDTSNTLSISALDTAGNIEFLADAQRMTYNGDNLISSNDAVFNSDVIMNNNALDFSNASGLNDVLVFKNGSNLSFNSDLDRYFYLIDSDGNNSNSAYSIRRGIGAGSTKSILTIDKPTTTTDRLKLDSDNLEFTQNSFTLGGETLTAGSTRLNYKSQDLAFLSDVSGGGAEAKQYVVSGQSIPADNAKYLFSSCIWGNKPCHLFYKNTTNLNLRVYDDFTLANYNDYDFDISALGATYEIYGISGYQTFDMFSIPNKNALVVVCGVKDTSNNDFDVAMNWFSYDPNSDTFRFRQNTPSKIIGTTFGDFSPPAIRAVCAEYSHDYVDSNGGAESVFAMVVSSSFSSNDAAMRHFFIKWHGPSKHIITAITGKTTLGSNYLPSSVSGNHYTTQTLGGQGFLLGMSVDSGGGYNNNLAYISATRFSDNTLISSSNTLNGTLCNFSLLVSENNPAVIGSTLTPSIAVKNTVLYDSINKGECEILFGFVYEEGAIYSSHHLTYDRSSATLVSPIRRFLRGVNVDNEKTTDSDNWSCFMPLNVIFPAVGTSGQSIVSYIPQLDLFMHICQAGNYGAQPIFQFFKAKTGRIYPVKGITGCTNITAYNGMATTSSGNFTDNCQVHIYNDNVVIFQQLDSDFIASVSLTNLKYAF